MKQADALFWNGPVMTVAEPELLGPAGYLRVTDGVITAVGCGSPPDAARREAGEVVDLDGRLLMPGLVNAHTHAAMTLFRGLADDLPLMDWLERYIFPVEKTLTAEHVYWGSLLACAEMIAGGVTTFCDMYLFENAVARAADEAGLRALVGEVLYDFPSPNYGAPDRGLDWTRELIQRWRGHDRVRIAVEPHAPYTCCPELLCACHALAQAEEVPLIIHVAETEAEVNTMIERFSRRPVEHLHAIGVLDARLRAAHAVHLSPAEIELLAANGVAVLHNPESNMKLASGAAPVPALLERGVTVALGTDGCASNNNLDLLQEMDSAAKLQKVFHQDAALLNARQVVRMATADGAAALDLGRVTGTLEPGRRADLIIVDFRQPHLTPVYDHFSHLVYAARAADVVSTMVDGRWLMRDRQLLTLDLGRIRSHIQPLTEAIGSDVGRSLCRAGIDRVRPPVRAARQGADLCLRGGTVLTMGEGREIIDDGVVMTAGDRICHVGPAAAAPVPGPDTEVIDCRGHLILPGLVNAHTHLPMSLFRGLADDLPLHVWLERHMFPAEARFMTPDSVRAATRLSVVEMLLGGTTTCADGYFHEDAVWEAALELGIRAVLAQGVIDFPAPGVPEPTQNLAVARRYLERHRDGCGRLRSAVFAHSPYTCGADTLVRAKALACEFDRLFFIHAAETRGEVEQVKERSNGLTPIRYLHELGVLDRSTVLVHAVHCDGEEQQCIAASGAGVVAATEANMKLGSGIAPLVAYRQQGVRLGLGTDGCASNNDADLFAEMGTSARLQKLACADPAAFGAADVLDLATRGGAALLGLDADLGTLEAGKLADIIVVSAAPAHATPLYQPPYSHLVYSASGADVRHVIVNGRLLVRDRQLLGIDLDRILEQVRVAAVAVAEFRLYPQS